MRLTGLYINGYGIFNDFGIDQNLFNGEPVIIYGPNEAGKSTLMSFIRGVLFGFKGEGNRPYPVKGYPVKEGRTGGWLLMQDNNGDIYRIERMGGRKDKVVVELPGGQKAGEAYLKKNILGGTSPVLYQNVFAIGMDELRRLEDLKKEEVSAHIYGTGTGISPGRFARVKNMLYSSAREIFNPRGRVPEINKLLRELNHLKKEIKRLEQQFEHYLKLKARKTKLEEEQNKLNEELSRLQERKEWLEKLIKVRDIWEDLETLRKQISSIDESRLKEQLAALDRLKDNLRDEKTTNEQLEWEIERHKELFSRYNRARSDFELASNNRKPPWISVAVAGAIAGFGIITFFIAGFNIPGFTFLASGVGMAVLIKKVLDKKIDYTFARYENVKQEVKSLEQQLEQSQTGLNHLRNRLLIIEREIEMVSKIFNLDRDILVRQWEEIKNSLNSDKEKRDDIKKLNEHLALIAGSQEDLNKMIAELVDSTEQDNRFCLEQVNKELKDSKLLLERLVEDMAELKLHLAEIEKGEELARARQEKSILEAKLKDSATQWRILTLCSTLLSLAKEKYERERQPAVLRQASSHIGPMTGGRYTRVISPVGSPDHLEVEDTEGNRVKVNDLSRGAANQLYLSLRLALARHYGAAVISLPVLLDDVMVDFDRQRMVGAVNVLGQVAREHQLLYFTCHSHVVEVITGMLPGCSLITI